MGEAAQFEHILESLHAAAMDDGRWPVTSGLIDEACGVKGNILVYGDGATHDDVDIFFARFCFRGDRRQDLEREYFADFHARDERIPRLRQLPDREVVHVSSLYTDEEKKRSAVYNDALPRSGTLNSLNVRLDGPGGSRIVWAIADPVDDEGWSSARVAMVKRLLPHLRQFVRVREALLDARALGASALELLDNRRLGIIQLDRRARVLATNDRARAILRSGPGLFFRDGELRAVVSEEDAGLRGMVAKALGHWGRARTSGSIAIRGTHSRAPLVVHVSPVGGESVESAGSRLGALVLLVDPVRRLRFDPDRLGDLLGLTPAESHIAALLAEEKTVQEIADARPMAFP